MSLVCGFPLTTARVNAVLVFYHLPNDCGLVLKTSEARSSD